MMFIIRNLILIIIQYNWAQLLGLLRIESHLMKLITHLIKDNTIA